MAFNRRYLGGFAWTRGMRWCRVTAMFAILVSACSWSAVLAGCSRRPVEIGRAQQGELLAREQASVASGQGFNPRTIQMLGWAGLSDAGFEERVDRLSAWLDAVGREDRAVSKFRVALSEVLLQRAFELQRDGQTTETDEAVASLFLQSAWHAWRVVGDAIGEGSIGGGIGSEMLTGQTRLALSTYNAAVGGFVESLSTELTGGEQYFYLDMADGTRWAVQLSLNTEGAWDPTSFKRFRAAATIDIEGLRFRHVTDSLGAALVAERLPTEEPFPLDFPPTGVSYPATAVVKFPTVESGLKAATLTVYNPIERATVSAWDRPIVLSADWTAPLADIGAKSRIDQQGKRAMLTPGPFEDLSRVYRLDPYDENKIPVLFVHGLRSSPQTWRDVLNDLKADPEIRERYQFWTFFYPSGLPIPRSAFYLRTRLAEVKDRLDPDGDAPWRGNMVIVGHSMGGVISRAILKDPGDTVYYAGHSAPPEDFEMDDELKDHLREVFFYEPEPDVSRAIFVSAPFRGSDMAESWFASFGRNITSVSQEFRRIADQYIRNNVDKLNPWLVKRKKGALTGVGSLSPESPFLTAYDRVPWRDDRLAYYVIVGNEEGDSDGVVEHTSSVLPGALTLPVFERNGRVKTVETEVDGVSIDGRVMVVDSGHNAHQSLAGGAAIWEILKIHLREIDAASAGSASASAGRD